MADDEIKTVNILTTQSVLQKGKLHIVIIIIICCLCLVSDGFRILLRVRDNNATHFILFLYVLDLAEILRSNELEIFKVSPLKPIIINQLFMTL